MEENKNNKKKVCITLSLRDYERLSQLAEETGRALAGYLRWLLHRHFREQDHPDAD